MGPKPRFQLIALSLLLLLFLGSFVGCLHCSSSIVPDYLSQSSFEAPSSSKNGFMSVAEIRADLPIIVCRHSEGDNKEEEEDVVQEEEHEDEKHSNDEIEDNEDGDTAEEKDDDEEEEYVRSSSSKGKKRGREKSIFQKGARSAKKLAGSAIRLTSSSMRSSLKAAVDLISVKHITRDQLVGRWKIYQEVELKPGQSGSAVLSCPATIQLLRNGTLITKFKGITYQSTFTFKENKWPKACRIEFSAHAFQGPRDAEPRMLLYKGYFKKSLLNPSVILMRGKMYSLSGKLWKKKTKCGKFKGSQRRYG